MITFTPTISEGEYAGEFLDDGRARMQITPEDYQKYGLGQVRETGDGRKPTWVTITDQATKTVWEVRSAPCGEPCYCAAEARPANA
jgi:hypothetical protein